VYVLGKLMQLEVVKLWHKDRDLQGCDFLVVPGGFAYGDYLRAGAIARFSPIMESVIEHANNGGNVMGICNGFQILTEAGLLPGALLQNDNQKYVCKNIFLKPQTNNSLFTRHLNQEQAYKIPIAHGEGRYHASDEILKQLNDNQQVLFRYCQEDGTIDEAANPNGSMENIAGICNEQRNVFGMMPHPERASDELVGNTDGRRFFESVIGQVLA